jgi:integral membrane protein
MNILRIIAWSEGISFLLFGVSMPLKYGFDIPQPNYFIGMAHGLLFILYNLMILRYASKNKWNIKQVIFLCFLSLLPFGTFYGDYKYLKN